MNGHVHAPASIADDEVATAAESPARATPDVRQVGSKFVIRRDGDPVDDRPEIKRLHDQVADLTRELAALREGSRRR